MSTTTSPSFITSKLYETKDNYIKELKDTLKNTDSNSILNIGLTVKENNNLLILYIQYSDISFLKTYYNYLDMDIN